jgi:hypothetical protein
MLWFSANCMTANPDKFQGIILGSSDKERPFFHVGNIVIEPQDQI